MRTALTIAGSDPTGGAGIQLDLGVFRKTGLHGLSAITSITAQNTEGVTSAYPLDHSIVREQIETLLDDTDVDSVKTGMLYSRSVVDLLVDIIETERIGNLVVDPVLRSSSGVPLAEDGLVEAMKEKLLPLTTMVTPNISEASLISGVEISDNDSLERAAKKIKEIGPDAVIITGGHLPAGGYSLEPDDSAILFDLFFDGKDFHRIEGERFPGNYHGTGCAFSAALAAYLALGLKYLEAAIKARSFVSDAIKNSYRLGRGMLLLGV